MDTIFMDSGSSKTSDPHILLLSLSDKINLKRSDKVFNTLVFNTHGKI